MKQALPQSADGHPEHEDCSIGLVLTGGTIGAHEDNSVLSVRGDGVREAELIERVWPGEGTPRVSVVSPIRTLSENLRPRDWVLIAAAARDLVESEGVTSVLILHGTDTMAYTAAALSFLLVDLSVPIVLTGANVPSGEAGSDAAQNVRTSLIAGHALERGTYVVFAGGTNCLGRVYLGTRVRKLEASSQNVFISVNRDLVGVIDADVYEERTRYLAQSQRQYVNAIDDRVLALRLYPGLDLEMIFHAIVARGIRGVVIELYASATGPDTEDQFSLTKFIRQCTEKDIVVGTTVARAPKTNGKTYETTVAIHRAGGLFLRDMLPETATVKMMWALAQTDKSRAVADLMLRPIAGEIGD
jgi:L-asparaginase type I